MYKNICYGAKKYLLHCTDLVRIGHGIDIGPRCPTASAHIHQADGTARQGFLKKKIVIRTLKKTLSFHSPPCSEDRTESWACCRRLRRPAWTGCRSDRPWASPCTRARWTCRSSGSTRTPAVRRRRMLMMIMISCSNADLLTGRVVAARAGESDVELRPLREHGPLVQQRAVALQPPGHLQYSTVQYSTVHWSSSVR